jgi:hypothetical protein
MRQVRVFPLSAWVMTWFMSDLVEHLRRQNNKKLAEEIQGLIAWGCKERVVAAGANPSVLSRK